MSSSIVQNRFVDYLFELSEGKVPEILKPQIERIDGDTVFLKGSSDIKTAVILHGPPYDSNMPCLGMALFGMFWPSILPSVAKIVKKRMEDRKRLVEK